MRADAVTTITEPAVMRLAARVLEADGVATAEVVVDPRPVGARRVELTLQGAGSWAGAATTDAHGRVHRTLRAPATPGEARVTVALDGVVLRVRPRMMFRAAR